MNKHFKGQTGTSLGGRMIRIKNKKVKNGVLCKNCKHFSFGYYCSKKRKSVEYKNNYRKCKFYKKIYVNKNRHKNKKYKVEMNKNNLKKMYANTCCSECDNLIVNKEKDYLKCSKYNKVITTVTKAINKKIENPDWCEI